MTLNYFIFRSDVRRDSIELMSAPVIENPEHQTLWYSKYFLGKFHHNYVGQDSEKSTYVLSVVEEKSFGKSHQKIRKQIFGSLIFQQILA